MQKHNPKDRYHLPPDARRAGIGLYTYEQQKNTTPFQYVVHIVVGGVIAVLGGCLLYQTVVLRHEEIRKYGSSDAHVWAWLVSFGVLTIGLFLSHAGMIFYFRRLRNSIHKIAKGIRRIKWHQDHGKSHVKH